jgi:REP element-mobilizing transposase RayT
MCMTGTTTWLLTFRCYGTWLPGDRRGYIERTPDGRTFLAPPRERLEAWVAERLPRPPFTLDARARAVVDAAIHDQCRHAGWSLQAVHVRTNHVHVVLQGNAPPDRMMSALKARATRLLRAAGLIDDDAGPWARQGSTVPLRTAEALERACRYVVEGQGVPLRGDADRPAAGGVSRVVAQADGGTEGTLGPLTARAARA